MTTRAAAARQRSLFGLPAARSGRGGRSSWTAAGRRRSISRARPTPGTLAFEFSVGAQRVIVNCGAPDAGPTAAREAARATAAHSTLVLADRSSSRFASPRARRSLARRRALFRARSTSRSAGGETRRQRRGRGLARRLPAALRLRPSTAAWFWPAAGDRLEGQDRLGPRQDGGRKAGRRPALRDAVPPALRAAPSADPEPRPPR